MQITIIKPGLLSTVQDLGRPLHLSQAVPLSGAMDALSARIANKAVGNDEGAAVIEFTYADAAFKAGADLLIAYAGDGATLKINQQHIPSERPLFIPAGATLTLAGNPAGSRTCIAVAGGWDVADVLGSKSTYLTAAFGGFNGRALQAGDVLANTGQLTDLSNIIFKKLASADVNYPKWSIPRQLLLPGNRKNIRVVPAHEFTWFDSRSIIDFLSTPFAPGLRSNRMGYHLEGAHMNKVRNQELLSTAVTPGTIQVTGSGSMILLMADCQTTGGYPRIAQVAAVDLPLCAQLKPGDAIYFKEISRREAEMLYLEREQELNLLTLAVRNKFL